jgi:hypothetical protein
MDMYFEILVFSFSLHDTFVEALNEGFGFEDDLIDVG